MISVSDARAHLIANAPITSTETVALDDALSHVLAEDVTAQFTQPPFAASAMDGYAIRKEDAVVGKTLTVTGMAPAGRPFVGCVKFGDAIRIFTGSVMPDLADHVVIQEDVEVNDNADTALKTITITQPQSPPSHIRAAGIDFNAGDTLFTAGTRLGPIHLSVLASANIAALPVRRRPRVCVFANGDELRTVGSTVEPGQILASTGYALTALIKSWGADANYLGIIPDDKKALQDAIKRTEDADIIVPLGGASVGDFDLVRDAFKTAGFDPLFEKIAVKPGKPTWSSIKDSTITLGLPGNPASGLVCAHLFLKPLIEASLGLECPNTPASVPAKLTAPLGSNGSRASYNRAFATHDEAGHLCVTPFPRQDSSLLTPFARANALVESPPHAPARQAGEITNIVLLHTDKDLR